MDSNQYYSVGFSQKIANHILVDNSRGVKDRSTLTHEEKEHMFTYIVDFMMNYDENDVSKIENFIPLLAKFKGLKDSSLVICN